MLILASQVFRAPVSFRREPQLLYIHNHLTKMNILLSLHLFSFVQCVMLQTNVFVSLPKLGFLVGSTTKTAWSGKDIYQFLGIPYAKSPSKNLRFKPPVPRSKWFGVRDATKFGNPCPSVQNIQILNEAGGDIEDCLNLSVYTKNLRENSAVMVYIHGGGFLFGSASEYHPNYLLEKNIVLVVLQYRLGVLGFLSTGTSDIPGNMAILDVKLALEWVQNYIHYFGGNPNRVTLFGQSAGASIVSGLMISPAISNKLFHRTIIQSGAVIAEWSSKPYSVTQAQGIAEKLNCDNWERVKAIHKCLIRTPVAKLLEVSADGIDPIPFAFTTGDYNNIFPTKPDLLAQEGTEYPMIAGVTKHEGTFLLSLAYDLLKKMNSTIPPREFVELLVAIAKEKGTMVNIATKLFLQPDETHYTPLIPGLIDLSGTITIKSPVLRFAQLNARQNPTYLYTFDYEGENTRFGYGSDTDHYPFRGGVHHSDDNIYLFASHQLNKKDTTIAKFMIELWTSFAIDGEPETPSVQMWKPMTSLGGPYLNIDERCAMGTDFLDEFLVAINDNTSSLIRRKWT